MVYYNFVFLTKFKCSQQRIQEVGKYLIQPDFINLTSFGINKKIIQEGGKEKVYIKSPNKGKLLFYILIDDKYEIAYGFTDAAICVGVKDAIVLYFCYVKKGIKLDNKWKIGLGIKAEDFNYSENNYWIEVYKVNKFEKRIKLRENVDFLTLSKGYVYGNCVTEEVLENEQHRKNLSKLSKTIGNKFYRGPRFQNRKDKVYSENEVGLIRYLNATADKRPDGLILKEGQYITKKGMNAKEYENMILRNNPSTSNAINRVRSQRDLIDTITSSEIDEIIRNNEDEEPLSRLRDRLVKELFYVNDVSYLSINGNILFLDLKKPIQTKVNAFMLFYSEKDKCFGINYTSAPGVRDRTKKNKRAEYSAPKYYLKRRFYLKVLDPQYRSYQVDFYNNNHKLLGKFNYSSQDKSSKREKIFRVRVKNN